MKRFFLKLYDAWVEARMMQAKYYVDYPHRRDI